MSCTENESGPFVVFFLPAVVGCLTILLARRWANSQVSNTSSTAVSRRRKIIKDPLVKRPLPTITNCNKMVPPVSKKANGISKKSAAPNPDEEANGGKRVTRLRASTNTTPAPPEAKLPDVPAPPKHVPFPYIPQDSTILFESMTFMFALVMAGLQFLNLYRTAWWLPNSQTNQAMNFHLIDIHLVVFIATLVGRRFFVCGATEGVKYFLQTKAAPHVIAATRLTVCGMIFSILMFCLYSMVLKYPLIKIFFLCYPAVIYLFLFGLSPGPFLELNESETPPMHSCSSDPDQVIAEVEVLRQDFNTRVKKIIFNSVLEAYYTSFIPCCFAQWFVYYDVYQSSQQTVFAVGACVSRYASHLLCAGALHAPHAAAAHLALIAPTDTHKHHRFYMVFSNPSTLLCFLLCTQLALIVLQLCLLFNTMAWHNFLAIVVLLFINYYTLFKVLRDYLIAFKVYKAESMIQDKNNSIPAN